MRGSNKGSITRDRCFIKGRGETESSIPCFVSDFSEVNHKSSPPVIKTGSNIEMAFLFMEDL